LVGEFGFTFSSPKSTVSHEAKSKEMQIVKPPIFVNKFFIVYIY